MALTGFLIAIALPAAADIVSLAFSDRRTFFPEAPFADFFIHHWASLAAALILAVVLCGYLGFYLSVSIHRAFQMEVLQEMRRRRFEKLSSGASLLIEKAEVLERRNKRFKF